jgi:hypothetical protein
VLQHVDLEQPLAELVNRGSERDPEGGYPSAKGERPKGRRAPVLPSAQAQESTQIYPEGKDQRE